MNTRNISILTGYFPSDSEKLKVHYGAGNGEKKSYFNAYISVRNSYKNEETGKYESQLHAIKAFGANADYIHNYVKPGDIIQVDGEWRKGERYEREDGSVGYAPDYNLVNDVTIISSKANREESDDAPEEKKAAPAPKKNPFARLKR